jgi:DnaJ-class molecular chaperone
MKNTTENNKIKCSRCGGKGGYEQLTGFSEDDTAWDLCPDCDGSGCEPERKYND